MTNMYLLLALVLLVLAVVCDLRTREIPDWIPAALIVWGCLGAIIGWANVRGWMVLSGGVMGLIVGLLMAHFGEFGGGDAKLLAAMGAVLGPVALLFVMFWMALVGGLLALIAVARGQRDYAYAPAIAAGFAAYLICPVGVLSW